MLTQVKIQKVELSTAFAACYLSSEDFLFVIFLPALSGKLIQQMVAKASSERPTSFDIILSLITALDLTPLHILIENESQGVFFTKIFFEKSKSEPVEIIEIDARPSDAIALGIKYQLPLLIHTDLLQKLNNLNVSL